jgi:hypothetical protein
MRRVVWSQMKAAVDHHLLREIRADEAALVAQCSSFIVVPPGRDAEVDECVDQMRASRARCVSGVREILLRSPR